MAIHTQFKLSPCATALAALFLTPCWAQTPEAAVQLDAVSVSNKSAPVLDMLHADVGSLGQSLAKTPQSVSVLGADLLGATGAASLSQVIKLDASMADSYNTTGYVEGLSVRGFLLDPGNNFRHNGLPFSNLAPLALENIDRIEVLKGVSGLQSGVSAPGGLVNFVTKRPQRNAFTTLVLAADGWGGSKAHIDSNTTWAGLGLRVNLATEALRTAFDRADGQRELASLALTTQATRDTQISAELEYHHKAQPSVPGLGLLDINGDGVAETLPPSHYTALNLNNQSWSQPFEASSSKLHWVIAHQMTPDWQVRLALGLQRTVIHDRLTFPDGCSAGPIYVYPGLCGNGDVDLYDYRSENERRNTSAWNVQVQGKLAALGVSHQLQLNLSGRSADTDLAPRQAYNFVGTSNISSPLALPFDASANDLNSNSRERAIDAAASLISDLSATLQSFVGWRTSRVSRSSARSDGSHAIRFEQTVSTPWAGLGWSPSADTVLYASWGQGVELEAVPNRPTQFINAGQVLPAFKSEQTELGLKWQPHPRLLVSAAVFSITKPYADNQSDTSGMLLRVAGGKTARHQGLELSGAGQLSSHLSIQASLALLDAKITRAVDPALVGQSVTNVPRLKASLFSQYKVSALPGFSIHGLLSAESGKTVNADGSVKLPAAWQVDAGLQYQTRLLGRPAYWQLNVENLSDRRYWREAPTQSWGGTYLFGSTARTARLRLSVEL